ncbi:hypothetical protein ACSS6W_003829 [Trichoderma asperelloides]|uniref:Dual specificity protein kinase FUZ7 n=1 Tax=Trichoderma asperellum TaxID=101201 RepID=A0A6V8QLR8_TRIAP|nr:protein kinase-like domain-containing protein [Trichoderma asperelloides]GFP52158.1 dual specificity protein kinase FUZ7 [Trichoderma asperellum]
MSDPFAPRTMKRKNVKGLALTPAAPRPSPTADTSRRGSEVNKDEAGKEEQLEIGIEYKLDLRPEELEVMKELGSGNGGTVSKVKHLTTGTVMARKVIHVEAKKEMRRRIVRELQIMHGCHSDYIVTFYGAFLNHNNDVIMCMEYMDVGALDRVSRVFGPIRVDVLGKIAEATLGGLTYLYVKHHIMHRDIKPSNILINSRGSIKLCDFGVSGELVNSIADTFVGTSTYMAPERIQGEKYTVKSDVWSFGLTIMELAIGKFPFNTNDHIDDADSGPAGILDLLQQIVNEPAPKLPKSDAFPSILEDMIQKCLFKEPEKRPTPQELFERDPFVQAAKRTPVDLKAWAFSLMEKDNRKSHLVPQMSPSGTQDLLRSSDSSPKSRNNEEPPANTPQYGEIPIAGVGIFSPKDRVPVQDRSPSRNGAAVGRPAHPGLGQRGATTNSIPQVSASNAATFNLPVRPAPPTSSFASQGAPQKPVSSDEVRSQSRRQPKFGLPSNPNPSYGV